MQQTVISIAILFSSLFLAAPKAGAVIGNPYWCYTGMATLPCVDGVYFGWVYCGMAQGEGYFYFYDGTVFHGNFQCGVPHGQGEVLTRMGYIAGIWDRGNFVQTVSLPQYQVQQYYTTANTNYYSTPQVRQSYQTTTSSDFALSDYTIEDVSDTQFGRQLMGKMR